GADWLVLLSFALVLPPIFVWRMPASASPDLPLFFLALTVVWAISLLEEEKGGAAARLLPVLLAAGAVGLKLNGLPLLVVASVYYVRGGGFSTRRLLTAGALVALMLLPTIAHGVVTSGCPVFPSKLLCVEAPWSVGEAEAERLTRVIRDWSRWNGTGLHWKNDWSWLGPWATKGFTSKNLFVTPLCLLTACAGAFVRAKTRLRAQGTLVLLAGCAGLLLYFVLRGGEVLMVSVTAAAVVAVLTRRGGQFAGRAWILAAGLAGMALTLFAAPAFRFGLGYTAVLFGALLVPAVVRLAGEAGAVGVRRVTLAALLTACGLIFFTMTLALEAGARAGEGVEGRFRRLLLPPALPEAAPVAREVNGLRYFVPSFGELCWATELPCAQTELPRDVTLRDPERGLRGGFVHTGQTPNR
ncbi:MAG: hypothetical protein ACJ74T_01175, partial [Pyrinomonadaceae bacterium]